MPEPSPQRAFALDVVQKLRAAGFEALWAGGCVRDQLLGLHPKDYDVATSAKPDEIRNLFGHRRTLTIGAAFGVIVVLGRRHEGQIEVTTFRTDATYSDGRHPDAVHFTTAEHDAQRRDFTINGLFYDPVANEVVDYVGGRNDLDRRLIRAIGDPRLRFGEDKLRLLRAVRFAAMFNFAIEPQTFAAIQAMAGEINTVSAERIGAEIRQMLTGPSRAQAIDLLQATNLLPEVLPDVAALDGTTFQESRRILAALDQPSLAVALAALLQSTGDPQAPTHLGRRLRLTNKEIERTAWLLAHQSFLRDAPHMPWPQLQRVLIHDGIHELVALHEATTGPPDPALAFVRERLAWPADRLNPPPLVDGSDLIRHGLAPSPQFADLLEAVRDAQLRGDIETTRGALALVQRILDDGLDTQT